MQRIALVDVDGTLVYDSLPDLATALTRSAGPLSPRGQAVGASPSANGWSTSIRSIVAASAGAASR